MDGDTQEGFHTAVGTSIQLTPICNAQQSTGPLCYLLSLGGCSCLLDCGWAEPFRISELDNLKRVASTVDVVLISHPDTDHLGGLPHAMAKLGLEAKVFATLPVVKMGQMFLYDHCLSKKGDSEFEAFTLDEIDSAFSQITPLKYNEEHFLSEHGLTLTAHASGHLVGGTVWQITKNEQDVVYAVDYNHRKERHLGAVKLHSTLSRPAVLVTHASDFENDQCEYGKRNRAFFRSIASTLDGGGNVLIPTDTAGRVLELIILLEEHWNKSRISNPLVLLSTVAYSTLEFAKSQLEWMVDAVAEAFERDRDNPFQTRYLQVCHTCEELFSLSDEPKVVLASMPSLECGLCSELLVKWAEDSRNMIIMTSHPQDGTVAQRIKAHSEQSSDHGKNDNQDLIVSIKICQKVDLEGKELEEFEAENEKRAELDRKDKLHPIQGCSNPVETENYAGEQALESLSQSIEQPLRTSSTSISRLVRQPSGAVIQMLGNDIVKPGTADCVRPDVLIDGFEVPEGVIAPMFPFEDDFLEWDDYGEVFDAKSFFVEQPADEESDLIPVAPEVHTEVVPTKMVVAHMSVTFLAQFRFFDFSGRTDSRFMRHMISDMAPRHLVIVHGSSKACRSFKAMAELELPGINERVYCPDVGETVDVSSGTSSFRIAVSDEIMERVNLRTVKGYQLAWVEGRVEELEECGVLQLVPPKKASDAQVETLGGIFIGDVRLSGIKTALEEAGIAANFHGKSLVCSGDVQIKLIASGHILMEGALSEEQYKIRSVLYDQYHIC